MQDARWAHDRPVLCSEDLSNGQHPHDVLSKDAMALVWQFQLRPKEGPRAESDARRRVSSVAAMFRTRKTT